MLAITPIALVGVVFLSLLSAVGVPVAEWLFPLIGVTAAGLLLKSNRAFQAIRWTLLGLAIALCLNGMALRMDRYAGSSALMVYQAAERSRLGVIRDKLRQKYPPNKELQAGRLATFLAEHGELTTWSSRELRRVWHTAFTGLYRVVEIPGEAWYPGGPIATGAGKVEWKPKNSPDR